MSINDEMMVIWKTNCKWRDCEHIVKRKDIKALNVNTDDKDKLMTLPLKSGDLVKVKFGSRWYDAEIVEDWPVSKQGNYIIKNILPAIGKAFSYVYRVHARNTC